MRVDTKNSGGSGRCSDGLIRISDLGIRSVPAGAPAGLDPSDATEFSEVAEEISRLDFGGVHGVDWPRVVAGSEVVLREKGKSLRMGAYLAYGLYETHGLRGLGAGLGVIVDMVDGFWTELHPPLRRLRGRVRALEWLSEKSCAKVANGGDGAADVEACRYALAQAEKLMQVLAERAADTGDAVWPVVRALRLEQERIAVAADAGVRRAEAPGESEPADDAGAGNADTPAGRRDENAVSGATSARILGEVRKSMLDAARALRDADAADPRAYVLHRAAVWLPICEAPPSAAGRTALPPPPRDIRGGIEASMTGGDFRGALALCEDAATDSLFWLDAHRIASEALASMGHEAAARAVGAQTGALLHRLPMLKDLSFNDGTPFAGPATLRWLRSAQRQTDEQDFAATPGRAA